jgi:hypothetical protein
MVFMSTNFFKFRDFYKFIFVATVFERECCAFRDVVKKHLRFIFENLSKLVHPVLRY